MLTKMDNKLVYHYDAEELWIEPWGINALRIRASKNDAITDKNWALHDVAEEEVTISIKEDCATIINGKIKAVINKFGKIVIYNQKGELLLEEYNRNRRDVLDSKCSAIEVEAREFKPIIGGNYHLTWRLESIHFDEKIYGMGQYQQPYLD